MTNGRMRVSGLFHSDLVNEKSRVSALAQKSVRTIAIREALEGVPKGWRINKGYKEGFFHTERSGGYFFLDAIKMEGEIDAGEFYLAQQTAMIVGC